MSTFYSYIHRLLSIPLNYNNYNKELQIIKQISFNNGYEPTIIDNLIKKVQYKKAINEVFPLSAREDKIYHVITYVGPLSNKISNHFKKYNINIAFKTNKTFQNNLKNNKDKTNKEDKSGVYELSCGTCDKKYIGQTGRTFKQRIKEHKYAFTHKLDKSNYSSHLIEENHTYNEKFKILHTCNKRSC